MVGKFSVKMNKIGSINMGKVVHGMKNTTVVVAQCMDQKEAQTINLRLKRVAGKFVVQ